MQAVRSVARHCHSALLSPKGGTGDCEVASMPPGSCVLTKQEGIVRAYHNDPQIKADILAQLAAHREADQLVKGQYWRDGKGCAVGCTIHSNDHAEYETHFGIPQMLARLKDCIFDGLPNEQAMAWPERFMGAIMPGSDLSRVG
jgi:hypothetical protein